MFRIRNCIEKVQKAHFQNSFGMHAFPKEQFFNIHTYSHRKKTFETNDETDSHRKFIKIDKCIVDAININFGFMHRKKKVKRNILCNLLQRDHFPNNKKKKKIEPK